MLLVALASAAKLPNALTKPDALEAYKVRDMPDGGMGSIRFVHEADDRRADKFSVAEFLYNDADGVQISFALNLDNFGEPWEIDAWKFDSSPLRRPPTSAADLRTPS